VLVAAIVTLFSLTSAIPAHAANSSLSNESEAVVILDNMEKRVAASEDAQYKYIATLIKTSNTVTLEKIDKATSETVSINTYLGLTQNPYYSHVKIQIQANSESLSISHRMIYVKNKFYFYCYWRLLRIL
jgi:hypothetical protein